MGLLLVCTLIGIFELLSMRFGADTREPGDWQTYEPVRE